MSEIMWKKITYPGIRSNMYLISENGDVKNILTGQLLTGYPDKDGYIKYYLCKSESGYATVFAHRLVAFQFIPNPNNYPVVDHLDGIKQHNHYTNLEWVTVRENTLRAERMGLRNVRGEANGHSKWTEDFVRSICEKFQDGWSIKDVYKWASKDPDAKYTGNDSLYTLIYRLKKKELWPDVVCEYEYDTNAKKTESWNPPIPQSSNYKYSEEEIRSVCQMLQDGKSILDIVEMKTGKRDVNGPFYVFIQGIRSGRNWTNISKDYVFKYPNTDRQIGCSKEVANMVDEGYTKKEIRNHFGIFSKETKEGQAIDRMIDRYKKAKRLGRSIIIYEDVKDSN